MDLPHCRLVDPRGPDGIALYCRSEPEGRRSFSGAASARQAANTRFQEPLASVELSRGPRQTVPGVTGIAPIWRKTPIFQFVMEQSTNISPDAGTPRIPRFRPLIVETSSLSALWRIASCRQRRAQRRKIVYRQATPCAGQVPRHKIKILRRKYHVGSATFGHQDSRPDARARRATVGADDGGSRRRGDQDRTARRRRRCARLRPALPDRPRGQGQQQQLVLSLRQPRQEIRHRQHREPRGPGDHPRTGKVLRRDDGELQGRRPQALQARL